MWSAGELLIVSLSVDTHPGWFFSASRIMPHIAKLPKLKNLCLNGTNYSKVDHEYVKKAVKQERPDLEV